VQRHTVANSEHGVSGHSVRADRYTTHGTSYPNICFLCFFFSVLIEYLIASFLQLILKFDLPCECGTEEWYVS
jgi:hypothetical protein